MAAATMSIGELSERTGLSADALRYYEKVGLLPGVERDAGGRRRYPEGTVLTLQVIKDLRAAGFGIREIQGVMQVKEGTVPAAERLRRMREVLLRLQGEVAARRRALDRAERLLEDWLDELAAALANPDAAQ